MTRLAASRRTAAAAALTLALAAGLVAPAGADAHCPAPAPAAGAPAWPPPPATGSFDVAHFGEGHWNEGQGPTTMPILVQDVLRYAPAFVAFSSDMANNGDVQTLACFGTLMAPIRSAGIPWFDSPGNHDRFSPVLGGFGTDIANWRTAFAGMPAPWGDGAPPGAGFVLPSGEPDDGPGAATHYYFDYGPPGAPAVRVIVLDNSLWSITTANLDQFPAVGPGERDLSQFTFLQRAAEDARSKGLLTFVMMHMPTQDPRAITNVHPISINHTMAKGLTADNLIFDVLAQTTGVDAVLLGHIQGNVVYRLGDVAYFIDGGGGGSPYALREVGIDTGYYYGFRLLRMFRTDSSWTFRTYFLPLVDRIEVAAPPTATAGTDVTLQATAVQPFDPALGPRLPVLWPNEAFRLPLRPVDPSRVDAATVPRLAYMWSTSNPGILAPIPGPDDPMDDPAFDPATMTTSGRFRAVAPGTASITIATGTHSRTVPITVTG